MLFIFVVFVFIRKLNYAVRHCCYVIFITQSLFMFVAFNIKHRNNIPNTLSDLETIETILIDVCRKFSVRTLLQNAKKFQTGEVYAQQEDGLPKGMRIIDFLTNTHCIFYFIMDDGINLQKVAEFISAIQFTEMVVNFFVVISKVF